MKKQAVNLSWPAQLYDFKKDTVQENFSRGKLRVFYKGETEDHRLFSDSFSEQLIQSLPYTPVVGYYDEEQDDFVGHAAEQQILGIVDPLSEIVFEKDEDGFDWCVCDVALYTERPDLVGKLAKKVIGHKQSLELDPNTVEYKINYDTKKHFKNIEFTAGTFVGLSVLGDNQKPAFPNSAFFSYDEQFEKKMTILKQYCEQHNQQEGGNTKKMLDFIKASWGEKTSRIAEALCSDYENDGFTMINDVYDDFVIFRLFYYNSMESKLYKIKYTIDDQLQVTFGDIVEVIPSYEEIPSKTEDAPMEDNLQAECKKKKEDMQSDDSETNTESDDNLDAECKKKKEDMQSEDNLDAECKKKKEDMESGCKDKKSSKCEDDWDDRDDRDDDCDPNDPDDDDCDPDEKRKKEQIKQCSDETEISNAEVTQIEGIINNDEQISKEANSSATSLTESERAEFESLKREKKVNTLNSFKNVLTDDEYASFLTSIDSFDDNTLELELLKKYKSFNENNEQKIKQRAFSFAQNLNQNQTNNSIDDFIKRNL